MSTRLIHIKGHHEIEYVFQVSAWPELVDPHKKGTWTFRPDEARVILKRARQIDPWQLRSVYVSGFRVLLSGLSGSQRGGCDFTPHDRDKLAEVVTLIHEALALAERERLSITAGRSE